MFSCTLTVGATIGLQVLSSVNKSLLIEYSFTQAGYRKDQDVISHARASFAPTILLK